MKKTALAAFVLAFAGVLRAQVSLPPNFVTRSVSGQFIVHDLALQAGGRRVAGVTPDASHFRLAPSSMVVACERIKQLLWGRLDGRPEWRGKIFFNLRTALLPDERVTVVSEKFADGWQYQVNLPDVMEPDRFVRVVVQVLLLEIANRDSEVRSVEIPLWLGEGLSGELIASNSREIILRPPTFNGVSVNVSEQRQNPLTRAHQVLDASPPLTFEQLSWPADEQFNGGASEVYRCSAQLFVDRLLQLRDGPACMRAMLGELSAHFNWQIAFLDGFKAHFERTLDVEKWWAVQVAEFTGRDLAQTWPPARSWFKLDEIVRARARVRTADNSLPIRAEVNLQSFLRDSNGIEQRQFYQQKLDELNALRVRVSQDLVGLVDGYRAAIGNYLQKADSTTPFLPIGKQGGLVANPAASELAQRLDALEVRRMALKPQQQSEETRDTTDISAAMRP